MRVPISYPSIARSGHQYAPLMICLTPHLIARFRLLVLLAALSVPLAVGARGQGFAVSEQGTCTMGRGGATVAHTCEDGSAIFFNPAGLVGREGFTASAGATVIAAGGEFVDDRTQTPTELQNDPIPVPHGYLRYGTSGRLALGLGVYVPYGLGTKWPTTEAFAGRFLGYDNSLQSIYVQPTIAYQVTPTVRAGVGLTVVFGSVTLNRHLDLSEQAVPSEAVPPGTTFGELGIRPGTAFGDASLEGSGVGFGGNFGVQFEATDWLTFGVRFLTPVTIRYDGTAAFEPVPTQIVLPEGNPFGEDSPEDPDDLAEPVPLDAVVSPSFETGPLVEQSVETEITMPAQFVFGVSVQATDRLELLADYQWMGWSAFDRLVLDFETLPNEVQIEDYRDTHGLRLGAAYDVTEALTLRAGFITHEAAAPGRTVTPLLPEAYRNEYAVGLGWQPFSLFTIDLAYHYIDQNDRRGRVVGFPAEDASLAQVNSGLYRFNAHLFGATLTLHL